MRRRTCVLWAGLALSLGALLLVVVVLEALARPPEPGRMDAFFAARDRWAQRSFSSYRLEIEQEGMRQPRCRQEVEIRDEQVADVVTNTCAGPVLTIATMFDRIEEYNTQVVCGPNGCTCDGQIVARVTYDPALGYPRSLVIELEPQRRLLPAFTPFDQCTTAGFVSDPTITVVTLTPLP